MVRGNCQSKKNAWSTFVRGSLLALIVCFHGIAAQAMSFVNVTLPSGPPMVGKKPSGLQLQIHSEWVEGSGYRPVKIELGTALPARASRQFHITMSPNDWQGALCSVELDLELPQGSTLATTTILVPQQNPWHMMNIEVREEGRKIEDLSQSVAVMRSSSSYDWTEAYPALLLIDSDAPPPAEAVSRPDKMPELENQYRILDVFGLLPLMYHSDPDVQQFAERLATLRANTQTTTVPRLSDRDILQDTRSLSRLLIAPPRELPQDWRAYSSIDLIFISLADLQLMAEQNPEVYRAITSHVRGGGTLMVTDAGGDFSRLTAIDQVLQLSTGSGASEASASAPSVWRRLKVETYGRKLDEVVQQPQTVYQTTRLGLDLQTSGNTTGDEEAENGEDSSAEPLEDRIAAPPPESEDMFRTRSLEMGRVVAIKTSELREINPEQWSWLLEDLGSSRWQWFRRMGLSWQRANSEFWDFMIPGVGAAPVYAFLAIITGFVILIGPINYVWLARGKRLYLLLVTVPVSAALITTALIGYALIRDGLGTRARLMSFSEMADDGKVVSWSRQTYYAGVAPSDGLVYPNTASVFTLEAFPIQSDRIKRRMVLDDSSQRLTTGYLPSRTMSQLLVINQVEAKRLLEVERNAEGKLEIIHHGDQPLMAVIVYDNGSAYFAPSVPPASAGRRVVPEPIDVNELSTKLRILTEPTEARVPKGFSTPRTPNRAFYFSNADASLPSPSVTSNLMMANIQEILSPRIPPGRLWIAIGSDAPPFVPLGVPANQQSSGIHFIRGHW